MQPTSQPSVQPSVQPSTVPTVQPTNQPSNQPSDQPSSVPTVQPTSQPSGQPSCQPSSVPTVQPSDQPSNQPSGQPSLVPTVQPTSQPSGQPSGQPSSVPTVQPSDQPSGQPSGQPSSVPTVQPTNQPSNQPSDQPSSVPTVQPTSQPSGQPSCQPSSVPTVQPSDQPSNQPSGQPSLVPTVQPTSQPSGQPSGQPSSVPTVQPSDQPSGQPSGQPSSVPTVQPTNQPSNQPSDQPSSVPTVQPTSQPSGQPSCQPSSVPTVQPSDQPSNQPSGQPSLVPTVQPTSQPSGQPSGQPSSVPTVQPSDQPSGQPSGQPSTVPTAQPSDQPSGQPSGQPSSVPTAQPSHQLSNQPSSQPTSVLRSQPSGQPSFLPSSAPTIQPSFQPSQQPTAQPSNVPSSQPSSLPTNQPTAIPSAQPSAAPSSQPSFEPSVQPSEQPSSRPSSQPTATPSAQPSEVPTVQPTSRPSRQPSTQPTAVPTAQPTFQPSSQPTLEPSSQPSHQPSNHSLLCSHSPSQLHHQPLNQVCSPQCNRRANPAETQALSPQQCHPVCPAHSHPHSRALRPLCSPLRSHRESHQLSPALALPPSHQVPQQQTPHLNPAASPPSSLSLSRPVTPRRNLLACHQASPMLFQLAILHANRVTNHQVCLALLRRQLPPRGHQNSRSTVRVMISDLVAATSYDVYCVTESFDGLVLPLDQVLAVRATVSTACCRRILATLSAPSIFQGGGRYNALTVSFDALPNEVLRLDISLRNASDTVASGAGASPVQGSVFPSGVTVTNTSTSTVFSFSVFANAAPGLYILSLEPAGASAGDYAVTFGLSWAASSSGNGGGGGYLSILADGYPPPTPTMRLAQFSNDGGAVEILFDAPTNQAGIQNAFRCGQLLYFPGFESASCRWASPSAISIISAYQVGVGEEGLLLVNSTVTLLPDNGIKAECTKSAAVCAEWKASNSSSVVVAAPANPVLPKVVLSLPSEVDSCGEISIDVSASTGTGGRPWFTPVFSLTASSIVDATSNADDSIMVAPPDVTAVLNLLNNEFSISPPTVLPASELQYDATYTLSVELCNFLGACGQASSSVRVLPFQGLVPTVSIHGRRQISHSARNQLLLFGNAFTLDCNGTRLRSDFSYSWSVLADDVIQPELSSFSRDVSKFKLPPYALSPSRSYGVLLTVRQTSSGMGGRAQGIVSVHPSNIVAQIKGGSNRSVPSGKAVELDASSSYFADIDGVTPRGTAGLSFSWDCVQIAPTFNFTCPVPIAAASRAENIDPARRVVRFDETVVGITLILRSWPRILPRSCR